MIKIEERKTLREESSVRQEEVSQQNVEGEVDLFGMLLTILRNKKFILKVTFSAAFLVGALSLLQPNIYRAEILLASVQDDKSPGKGLAAALGGLGGMAAMVGVPMGGGADEYLAILNSREFLWQFAQEKGLMPILFENAWDAEKKTWSESDLGEQPGQMDLYRLMDEKVLDVNKDKKTGLVTVAIEWRDPMQAAGWADAMVEMLNQYLAQQEVERGQRNLQYLQEELAKTQVEEMRKTLFDLMANEQKKVMLASAQKEFAFKVLDKAVVPDKKIKPKRGLMVLLAMVLGFLLSSVWVIVRESSSRSLAEGQSDEKKRQLKQALRWGN